MGTVAKCYLLNIIRSELFINNIFYKMNIWREIWRIEYKEKVKRMI